jgi:hypothetical protein
VASFAAQLQAFADKTGEKLERVDVAFKINLFDRAVQRTRVDTGRLRGNWQVTTGAPAPGVIDRNQQAGGLIGQEAGKVEPFSVTYLTNNLPYAIVYDEIDGIIAGAVADAKAQLAEVIAKL